MHKTLKKDEYGVKSMLKIGIVQLTSGPNPKKNLKLILEKIEEACNLGVELIVTPEVINFMAPKNIVKSYSLYKESHDPTLKAIKEIAKKKNVWVLIGSLALTNEKFINKSSSALFANRSIFINNFGRVIARYDKIHLFDVNLKESGPFKESDQYISGNKSVVVKTPFSDIGMTICYDLRFPYLFKSLSKNGAKIIFVPSAFTKETGKAHWETLLRARAIENKVYIIAPAQCGTNYPGRETWGHSMAISPLGNIISEAASIPTVNIVDICL